MLYLTYFIDLPPWWFRKFFNAHFESRSILFTHGRSLDSDWNFAHFFLLDYLVKYVRVFWHRKNCPIYGQFLVFLFCENYELWLPIYEHSIFVKFDTYFIRFTHYWQEIFFTARIITIVLPAASTSSPKALQPLSCLFFIHFTICTIKVTYHKNFVSLLRKISKKATSFQPATVIPLSSTLLPLRKVYHYIPMKKWDSNTS